MDQRDNTLDYGLNIIKICELELWYYEIRGDEFVKGSLLLVLPVIVPNPVSPPPILGMCTHVCIVLGARSKTSFSSECWQLWPIFAVQWPKWAGSQQSAVRTGCGGQQKLPLRKSHVLGRSICNGTQVRLPAAMKANTWDAGADVKESGLFVDASHLEGRVLMSQNPSPVIWGLMSQSPSPGWMGELMSQSPSLPLNGDRGFYKQGEGNRKKRSREGIEKFSTCRWTQSIPIRQVTAPCVSSWFSSHHGFMSFRLHVILAPWMKVSKSPRSRILEGQSLYLCKLVPRILMLLIYRPHISQSQHL